VGEQVGVGDLQERKIPLYLRAAWCPRGDRWGKGKEERHQVNTIFILHIGALST
jgi:hypothetical protein